MSAIPTPRGGSTLAIALDPTHAADFDRVVRVAIRALNAPVAQFNLITETEQISVSSEGPGSWHGPRTVGLDASYCQYVVGTGAALLIDDARTHPLVRDNRATTEAGIGAYAAVPVVLTDGSLAGTFCVVDFVPRVWTAAEQALLEDLAASLVGRIELARQSMELEQRVAERTHELTLLNASLRHEADRRRESEAELERSAAHFRSLIENAPDLIAVLDRDGRYRHMSPSYERVMGYRVDEKLGQVAVADAHVEDLSAIEGAFAEFYTRPDRTVTMEARYRHADGRWRWLETTATNLLDDAVVQGIVANTRDITERREAELALVQAQERMRHILSMNPAGLWAIVIADGAWNYTWIADGVESVIGHTREEVLTPGWWKEHAHPDDRDVMGPAMAEMLDRGRARVEYRIRQKDGSYRWIRSEGRAVLDGDRLREVFGAWIDVTERHAAEAALRHSEDQLRQAQKMDAVGRLAGGVAHDFNNLLTVILAYGNMLAAQLPAGSDGRFGADEIVSAGQRAARLTHKLLAFSRKQVLDPRAIDINEVVRGMENLLARLIGSSIRTVSELAPDLAECVADHGQVEQVLMNLAVNARDAMPDGGTLTIATRTVTVDATPVSDGTALPSGRYVVLAVTDTGIGMDAATLPRIFDPFFTTKEVGRGTGLGLSTVYGILQQSGGRITVDSAPGVGSTFRAYLPVATGSALRAVRGTPAPARVPSAPEAVDGIVLVADDNSQVRKVTRTLLERRGYSVLEAENGAEALSLLSDPSRRVDLLVSDVVMPVMGGLQLVQRLNELRIDTRVLLVSGFTADAVIDRGSLPAGIAFLEKPFSEQALLASVSELLTSAPRAGRRRDIGADPDARPMIVVVDDTELNRVLVSMLLEDRYRVHTHAGGRSAIGMLGELEPRPELLLLDIDMPEVDGFELLESIRAHPGLAGCRVVAFTASASSEARNAYARAGFDAFLAKPIADPVAFLERIDEEVRLATLPTS